MKCCICNKELKNYISLSSHIKKNHFDITLQKYYDNFLKKENEDMCIVCGNKTKFVRISYGYKKTCSNKCNIKNAREKCLKK